MSIYKINEQDFQTITVVTRPDRYYSSSSLGTTGSVAVFARNSSIEKEITSATEEANGWFNDSSLEEAFKNLLSSAKIPSNTNIFGGVENLLKLINNKETSTKKKKVLDIKRYIPTPVTDATDELTKEYFKKLVIKDNLSQFYRSIFPSSHWAYCNYNSLNFFTSSTVLENSALVYPNYDDPNFQQEGSAKGIYTPNGPFSFDFYLNPRYNKLDENREFKAGTIFHLSSSYAISLITGSQKDYNGLPIGFRIQLQLSHSADISPSQATSGPYPQDLIFLSDDNSLKYNHWHHVVVRWGTEKINLGTGSFVVDGIERGKFYLPSGTIAPLEYVDNSTDPANPDGLFVGNYYEGTNSGNDRIKKFFTAAAAESYGTFQLDPSTTEVEPTSYSLTHPLKAELHDLTIKRYYVTDLDIELSCSKGLESIDSGIAFYVPPFFVEKTPIRSLTVWPQSGIPQTLKISESGTTSDPFNVPLAFGSDGHYINIENFLKDFATQQIPRVVNMSLSPVTTEKPGFSTNDYIYDQPEVIKRNLLIMPCDDGGFYPNYEILGSEDKIETQVDDSGNFSPGFIHLDNMLTNSPISSILDPKSSIVDTLLGVTPEDPLNSLGPTLASYLSKLSLDAKNNGYDATLSRQNQAPLAIAEKSKDKSSNQITIFDISNLYYGLKIAPKTFTMVDYAITGSGGAFPITLKDDGLGTLYRADSESEHCSWNSVGTIFYDEGIIVIKSPHLYFFGKEQFEISFKGEQNIHVLRFDVVAPANQLLSSSNPSFNDLPSSNNANESDPSFVYISGLHFHDENLNVVMKTQLAQPVMKRHSDRLAFKIKYDF